MKKYNRMYALAAVAVLCGCTVGPDYEKPIISLPASWLSSPALVADNKAEIEQDWWKHFHDPVLDQLITKAATGNFDLKLAEARISEARAQRDSTRSELLPAVNITSSGEREANLIAFPGPIDLKKPFNIFQGGFDASWELDLFGGKRREIEAGTAELTAATASRDDARVSLLAEVARTYVDIRQYQMQLAIAQQVIAADTHTIEIAKQRYGSGDAPRLEVTQAQSQLEQAQTQLPNYQNQLAQAEFAMDVLLGEQPGAAHAIVGEAKPIPVSDKALVLGAPASVIANRPDIRVAEEQLKAATAQQGVVAAQYFPDVSLSGFIGLLNINAGDLLKSGSKSWSGTGSVLWPILNYGKLSAMTDTADAQQQQALITYQKTILVALSDVEQAVSGYTTREEARASLERSVADNAHAVAIATMRYKNGMSSFAEVLDAQRVLYDSQSRLAQADAQASQNLIAVYKSLGGGWKDTATHQ